MRKTKLYFDKIISLPTLYAVENERKKVFVKTEKYAPQRSHNTAYTLWAYALALRDIAPFGRNVVYAEDVRRKTAKKDKK